MHVKTVPASYSVKADEESDGWVVEGYVSVFNASEPDVYGDIVKPGAFKHALEKQQGSGRPYFFWDHLQPLGKMLSVEEDETGLKIRARISKTTLGHDTKILVEDGAVREFSFGYDLSDEKDHNNPNSHGGFDITKVETLYECSLVGLAAAPDAQLTSVKRAEADNAAAIADLRAELAQLKATDRSNMYTKAASGDTDLPIASGDASWDGDAAEQAVAKWATNEDGELDVTKFGKAFFWKAEGAEKQGDFKLGFATVSDGELKAVPAGVKAAAASIQGARATPDIPESDVDGVKAKIATYYNRMDLGSPPWADDSSDSDSSESGSSEEGKASEETEEVDHSDERIAEAIEKVVTDLGDVARMLRERGGGSGEPPESEEMSEKTMEDFRRELAEFKSL